MRRRFLDEKIPRLYQARQIIFSEGDWPQGLLILCRGTVRLALTTQQGRQLTLGHCTCGDIFGEAAYLAGRTHFFSAEAATDCYVCLVPRTLADELSSRNPEFLKRMAVKSSSQLCATTQLASNWVFKSADARLADFLLSAEAAGRGAPPCRPDQRFTRRDVAEQVGLSPETVIRRLSSFKQRGFVKLSGKAIAVVNRKALESVSNGRAYARQPAGPGA